MSKEEWISCEKELPREGGRYWCFITEINSLGVSNYQWNCSYNVKEKRWSDDTDLIIKVTHWMHLPEPPI